MPIYEYQCTKCREVCEVLQKAKDKPLDKCPHCGGPMVKRISSPAIQFKGSGWYVNDYAKKRSTPSGTKTEVKPGPKDEAKTGTKTEAKAETKAEPKAASGEAAAAKPDRPSK
jgi:putative FmdB family regulatory protein